MKKILSFVLLVSLIVVDLAFPVLAIASDLVQDDIPVYVDDIYHEDYEYDEELDNFEILEAPLAEYITYDDNDDIVEKSGYESIIGFNNPVDVATHAELANAVATTPAGGARTINITAHLTGGSPIVINNGRQITLTRPPNFVPIITQTSGRHFSVSGAGSSLSINGITLCGGDFGTTLRGGITAFNGANLTLNGMEIRNGRAEHGGAMSISSANTVAVLNFVTLSNNTSTANNGGAIIVFSNAHLSTLAGVIENNNGFMGGGIQVQQNATANIVGTTIRFNTAGVGGGIGVLSGGHITTSNNVNIHDNTANGSGGGIYAQNASFSNNGTLNITGNHANSNGGGIASINGVVNLDGVTNINNNTSSSSSGSGGGIHLGNDALLTVNAPLNISGNEALQSQTGLFSGGGISVSGFESRMVSNPGGPITLVNNIASSNGGGMSLTNGTVELNETLTINNNTSGSHGGGAHISGGSVSFIANSNVEIINNHSGFNGGGINFGFGQFSFNSTLLVNNNSAANYGGGFHLHSTAPFSLSNATITNNSALNGGGIGRSFGNSLNINNNVNISNNSASENGGGIHNGSGANSQIIVPTSAQNVTISNNHAGSNGGGIYGIHSDQLTLPSNAFEGFSFNTPITFSGNTAGNGSSLPPLNANSFNNIRFSSTSIHNHPINNYDIVYTPVLPLLTRHHNDGTDATNLRIAHGTDLVRNGYLPVLERPGFRFLGWFYDSNLTNHVVDNMLMPRIDEIDVFAGWQAVGNVSIQLGGSFDYPITSDVTELDSFDVGTSLLNILMNVGQPTRLYHHFRGWYLDAAFTQRINLTQSVPTGGVVVHARWERIPVLRFDLGGTYEFPTYPYSIGASRVSYGDDFSDLVPSGVNRKNHRFLGWYVDSDFIVPLEDSKMPANDLTIYARWQEVTYLDFILNEIEPYYVVFINPERVSHDVGSHIYDIVSNIYNPTMIYHDFSGWYLDYALTNPMTSKSLLQSGTNQLFASWSRVYSPVTLILFGEVHEFDVFTGKQLLEILADFDTEVYGYEFVAWYKRPLQANFWTALFNRNNTSTRITEDTILDGSPVEIYGVWEALVDEEYDYEYLPPVEGPEVETSYPEYEYIPEMEVDGMTPDLQPISPEIDNDDVQEDNSSIPGAPETEIENENSFDLESLPQTNFVVINGVAGLGFVAFGVLVVIGKNKFSIS